MHGHFFSGIDGIPDFTAHFSAYGQLRQRRLRILFVDRVNLLPFGLCDGNGLYGGYAFRTRP